MKSLKDKGITLIALVVTIIVLLILAGVSIAMLTGENGILTQAQNAKKETEEAEEKEKIQLAVLDAIGKNNDLTEESLQKEIDDEFGSGETKVYENENENFSVIFQNKDTNYRIEDGKVTKIDIAFKIRNKEELKEFMEEVNGGNSFKDQYVYLLEDIDLENEEWGVIGSYTDDSTNKPFAGIFEGNNKTISNININKDGKQIGLFAYNTGIIKDLNISGTIMGSRVTGGINGRNEGVIENCSNSASVTSETSGYVGGINGSNHGRIIDSFNNGRVEGVFNVGGIAGGNAEDGIIEYCYNLGEVIGTGEEATSEGGTRSGGISGHTFGKINSCYNIGNIKSEHSECGGISGSILDNAEISNCYNIGEIYNQGTNLGNIVGGIYNNIAKVSNCYFSREICDFPGYGMEKTIALMETIERTINYMKTNSFVNDLNKNEEAYTIDSNLNNGYPILKWQVE